MRLNLFLVFSHHHWINLRGNNIIFHVPALLVRALASVVCRVGAKKKKQFLHTRDGCDTKIRENFIRDVFDVKWIIFLWCVWGSVDWNISLIFAKKREIARVCSINVHCWHFLMLLIIIIASKKKYENLWLC